MKYAKGLHEQVIQLAAGVAGVRVVFHREDLPLTFSDDLVRCVLLMNEDAGGMRWIVRGGVAVDKAGEVQPISAATCYVAEYPDPDDPTKTVRAKPTEAVLTMEFLADADMQIDIEVI